MPFRLSSSAGAGETASAATNMAARVFGGLDLFQNKFQPIEFAADLRLQMGGQWSPVAGLKFLQLLTPIAAQRLVAGHALAEQQALDATDVTDPFVRQCPALTRETAPVLFFRCRRPDHRTHRWLATLVRQQSPNQRLAVNLCIGIWSASCILRLGLKCTTRNFLHLD